MKKSVKRKRTRLVEDDLVTFVRNIVTADLQRLVDSAYNRIEFRVEEVVELVAPRVLPENVIAAVDTVVNNRTAALEEMVIGLQRELGRVAAGRDVKRLRRNMRSFKAAKRKKRR